MLSKDAIRILKYLYKHGESEIQKSCYLASKKAKSVHAPYLFEDVAQLEVNNLIYRHIEQPIPGEQTIVVRISSEGKAFVENMKVEKKKYFYDEIRAWVTLVTAIAAIIVSIIALKANR